MPDQAPAPSPAAADPAAARSFTAGGRRWTLAPTIGTARQIRQQFDVDLPNAWRDNWRGLDAPSLAAVVSCLIHEPRRERSTGAPRLPNDAVVTAYDDMLAVWDRLEDAETRLGLPVTGAPDAGLAWMVHRWAAGRRLDEVLRDADDQTTAAGDFVRRCKQVVDVLDQIADVAGESPGGEALARTARAAVRGVLRGVVAADRLD